MTDSLLEAEPLVCLKGVLGMRFRKERRYISHHQKNLEVSLVNYKYKYASSNHQPCAAEKSTLNGFARTQEAKCKDLHSEIPQMDVWC